MFGIFFFLFSSWRLLFCIFQKVTWKYSVFLGPDGSITILGKLPVCWGRWVTAILHTSRNTSHMRAIPDHFALHLSTNTGSSASSTLQQIPEEAPMTQHFSLCLTLPRIQLASWSCCQPWERCCSRNLPLKPPERVHKMGRLWVKVILCGGTALWCSLSPSPCLVEFIKELFNSLQK